MQKDYSLQSEIKHSLVLFWGQQMGFCMHITLVYLMYKKITMLIIWF